MASVQLRRYEEILERMVARVVSRTDLSDVIATSTWRHILGGVARELDEAYYQIARTLDTFDIHLATGTDLDTRAQAILPATVTRLDSVYAVGAVQFTRGSNVGTTIIPVGTTTKTTSGQVYKTTEQGQIDNPDLTSGNVAVIASAAGAAGNVASGSITLFGSKPAGIISVTNADPTAFGRDLESDQDLRARIKLAVAALPKSTVSALESAVLDVVLTTGQRVQYVKIVEPIINPALPTGPTIVYIDDGVGQTETTSSFTRIVTTDLAGPPAGSAVGGEEFLSIANYPIKSSATFTLSSSTRGVLTLNSDYYINYADGMVYFTPALITGEIITAQGTKYTGLIAAVQKQIDGDPNDRTNHPGYRAAGIQVLVHAPTIIQHTCVATLVLAPGTIFTDTVTAASDAVVLYVNSLGISGDIIRHEIVERIMALPGVVDITLAAPATNITTADTELPRITASNITIN